MAPNNGNGQVTAQTTSGDGRNAILRLLEDNMAVQIVVALSVLIGAITSLYLIGRGGYLWYGKRYRWTSRTQTTLEALRPNVVIDEFEDRLGRPRIVSLSEDKCTKQYIFGGRGYWVQAVVDAQGAVMMFAATACHPRLRPSWEIWNGRDSYECITLNVTRIFDQVSSLQPSSYRWFFSGATANSFVYAFYSGGNTSNYLTYAWGQNDACKGHVLADLHDADVQTLREFWASGPRTPRAQGTALPPDCLSLPKPVQDVFSQMRVNTIAIFGIGRKAEDLPNDFQIGADRILTRTVEQ